MALTAFATAAPKKAATTSKPTVVVPGISDKLIRLQNLRNDLDNIEAEKKMLEGEVKAIGLEEWCKMYQANKSRPDSFILCGDNGGSMMILPMDKYLSITAERATDLDAKFGVGQLTQVEETYSFNTELLNKHMDAISEAIAGLNIPEADKAQLLFLDKKFSVKKGSIERLVHYGNVAEVVQEIQPIIMLKNAKV